GHGDVEHDDIGIQARRQFDCLDAAVGFPGDGDIRLAVEMQADTLADGWLVIDEQDPDIALHSQCLCWCPGRSSGLIPVCGANPLPTSADMWNFSGDIRRMIERALCPVWSPT